MSGDCSSIETRTPHVAQSSPSFALSKPMSLRTPLTTCPALTYALVVIWPVSTTIPCITTVSQSTLAPLSLAIIPSRMASDSWSATLSGCPSATLSDEKRYFRPMN